MEQSAGTRILVVEDQPVPREVLARILARDGYSVQSAATAQQAVEIGTQFRPHLLLTDWLLPEDTNGLQVAEALRMAQPDMSVIFLTGLPTDTLLDQARHIQPCTFIEKPCDFQQLLQQVHDLAPRPD